MPRVQVATLAINSGLVAFPTGYDLVWSGSDSQEFAIWRPLPPPGYVALGCVAGRRTVPPPPAVVGCVAARAVVDARLGECLLLAERGDLWAVQNTAATFDVSPPGAHLPAVGKREGSVSYGILGHV